MRRPLLPILLLVAGALAASTAAAAPANGAAANGASVPAVGANGPAAAATPPVPRTPPGFRMLVGGARAVAPAAAQPPSRPAQPTTVSPPRPANAVTAMVDAGFQMQAAVWKAALVPLAAKGEAPKAIPKAAPMAEPTGAPKATLQAAPKAALAAAPKATKPAAPPAAGAPAGASRPPTPAPRPAGVIAKELEERRVELQAVRGAAARQHAELGPLRQKAATVRGLLRDVDEQLVNLVKAKADPAVVAEAKADRLMVADVLESIEAHVAAGQAAFGALKAKLAFANASLARTEAELRASTKAEADAIVEATAREAELERARVAADAAAKEAVRTERAARGDQHLVTLLDRGSPTDGYRRAAARVRAAAFNAPKARDAGEATEDAVAMNPEKGLYAISDGVTNSVYSGPLARLLVQRWTDEPAASAAALGTTWLQAVQADWTRDTATRPSTQAWFNANPRADATFLGARLTKGPNGPALDVMGVGDSMVFVVRGGAIARSFPYERSAQFTNVVDTLPSRGKPAAPLREVSFDLQPGDEVFMTTDALGKWVFTEVEAGRTPFAQLGAVRGRAAWRTFVDQAQAGAHGRPMDVDDTSLVRFVVPGL